MTELYIRIYRYFRSHRTTFWVTMTAFFVFFGFFASKIHLEEDINKLMPSSRNEDGSTKLAFADLRIKDKTFLLFEGKKGSSVEEISDACDAFIDSLMARNDSADSTKQMIGDVFYRISDDDMYNAIEYLSAHIPSYIDTAAYQGFDSLLTMDHMRKQMAENCEDLEGDFGQAFPELIETDPIGMRNVLMSQMASLVSGSAGSYKTINSHFFVPDSTVCVAFITPAYSATNTGQGSALFEVLNEEINHFAVTHPTIHISYHGTPASGYYNSTSIKHDLMYTVIGSLILVIVFICICFRNWDTIILLSLPVAFGTLFGLALMYFIKGQFSLLALGLGAIVLGVALSYVLHILTHFKYVNNAEQVLRDQVKPVSLACLTTIGSFMGLIFIKTDLLHDFGLFASFAVIGTTFFCLVFLPQLLNEKTNKTNKRAFAVIDKINNYPFDRNKPLIAVLVVIIVVCVGVWAVKGTSFDSDMNNLGYNEPSVEYSENLLNHKTFTGDKSKYFASSGKTMEEAIANFSILQAKLDSLKAIGLVKSYTPINQIFVPEKVQQQRIDAWKNFWNGARLDKVHSLINATAPQAGLEADAFEPFFEAATADYKPDAIYKSNAIPTGYLSTMMEQSYDGKYLCFTSVRCTNDSVRSKTSDYIRICDAIANQPNMLVLDTYYYTTDTLTEMNNDFNVLQWVSMGFVLIVLLVSFKFNVRHTLLGFAPILLSWLMVLGAMDICHIQFNLINIIISTFIFGIGVDYSIFVMNGLVDGKKGENLLAYHKSAIFFSAVILIVTVSSMLLATHPAINSVGFPTLVGMLSSVILSYVLQPAIFRLIDRRK